MLCQKCGKREANVHYTQMINNVKAEVRLCSKCAEKMGLGGKISGGFGSFGSLFDAFLSPKSLFGAIEDVFEAPRMFRIDGEKIYRNEFESELDKMFAGFGEEAASEQKENVKNSGSKIENLRASLKKAIEQERFEDAAKIRDEIKELEKKENQ